MPPIYITEQGTKIRIRNHSIRVEREKENTVEMIHQVPIGAISQVVLSGNIGLSTPAIAAFLEHNIDVVFLDSYGGFRGRLQTDANPYTGIRRGQYRALENKVFIREMIQCLLHAKLYQQKQLLFRYNRKLQNSIIESAIQKIARGEASLAMKTTENSLRGIEGKSAAAYFSGLRQLLDPKWNFRKREKNPSPDPVNAMLSFGYTILTQLSVSAIQTVGLDAYAGFLHEEAYNRPSLGLDLVEEFRPFVDETVLEFCESEKINPDDFTVDPEQRTCRMNNTSRKLFIQALEERMADRFYHPKTGLNLNLRQCIMEQARQIVDCCENAPCPPEYIPMEFE